MRRIVLCLLLVFYCKSTAQDSTSFFQKTATTLSLEGNYQRGNVQRTLGVARAAFQGAGTTAEFDASIRYAYGDQNSLPAENDALAVVATELYPHQLFSWLVFGTAETSRLRSIESRFQAGSGLKVTFISTNQHALKSSLVLLLDKTNFSDTSRKSIRASLRIKGKHTLLENKLLCTHESFIQPSILWIGDIRLQTNVSLVAPLSQWFAIKASVFDTYESIVQAGRTPNDIQITFGLQATL